MQDFGGPSGLRDCCCQLGAGNAQLQRSDQIMTAVGLPVNEFEKSFIVPAAQAIFTIALVVTVWLRRKTLGRA